MEVSPPQRGGGVRRMEEQNRLGSSDAKALYVSYQVDKTMGHGVYSPTASKWWWRVVACSQAVEGWVGLDCFPSMCTDSQNM